MSLTEVRASERGARKRRRRPQPVALAMVGMGLLAFGALVALLLPRSGGVSGPRDSGEEFSAIPAQVSYPAPELTLKDLKGEQVSLAGLRGQVVLVNSWATWCPPCKAEMPTLQAYYESHRDQGFVVVAIEAGEPQNEVAEFAKKLRLTFSVWPDPETKALRAFRNGSLPSSYVIDRQGVVRLAWTGAISQGMLEKHLTPLLRE